MSTQAEVESRLLKCLDIARDQVARKWRPRLELAVTPEDRLDIAHAWQTEHVAASEPIVRILVRLRSLSLPTTILEVPQMSTRNEAPPLIP